MWRKKMNASQTKLSQQHQEKGRCRRFGRLRPERERQELEKLKFELQSGWTTLWAKNTMEGEVTCEQGAGNRAY